MIHRERRDELGVSEVVGFIIVLGIVFMSIGMVYANAIPVLEDNREHQHITNTEKIFNTLDGNVDELTERDVTRRATHIRLFDSELSLGSPMFFINASDGSGDWDFVRGGSTLIYEHEGEQIVYENGAVIRTATGRNSSAMQREPGWVVRENQGGAGYTAVIQNVRLQGVQEISGDGPILVRKEVAPNSPSDMNEVMDDKLVIRVTSEHADAWRSYFERLADRHTNIDVDNTVEDNEAQIEFENVDSTTNRVMYQDYLVETSIST